MIVPVLAAKGLCKHFGALQVARDINFQLRPGARHALIGPNGAGKTTFINLIAGAIRPSHGHILLDGTDITNLPQAERVKRGVARTFQISTLFRGLTVLENIWLSVGERMGACNVMLRPAATHRDVIDESLQLLQSLRLQHDALRLVRELPYGRQRLVEIAIALGLHPKVLLLDEPTAGVPAAESEILLEAIDGLPKDVAVLIIEHDMDVVFRFAQRITVMVDGAVLVEGSPAEIAADDRVRAVYLGQRHSVWEAGHG